MMGALYEKGSSVKNSQIEKARDREISSGLLRQRRNLLGISIAMPLFFLSGAAIEKINILGTIIKIKNPEIITYSIVCLFVYFFIRYFQYYNEENHIESLKKSFNTNLFSFESRYFSRKATKCVEEFMCRYIEVYYLDPYHRRDRYKKNSIADKVDEVTFPFFRKCTYCLHSQEGMSASEIIHFHEKMNKTPFSDWPRLNSKNSDGIMESEYYQNSFSYCTLYVYLLRSYGVAKYILTETYFTDYQLPFIVAFLSCIVTISVIFI